jgi:hypothetical protein
MSTGKWRRGVVMTRRPFVMDLLNRDGIALRDWLCRARYVGQALNAPGLVRFYSGCSLAKQFLVALFPVLDLVLNGWLLG